MPKAGKPNLVILIVTGILVIFGLFMVTSAGGVISQEKFGQSFYFAKNQLLKGLLPGLILAYFFFHLPYHYLRRFASTFFVIGIILLILVFVPGLSMELGGAKRWLDLRIVNFQPSEVFKIAFVVYLAAFLEKSRDLKRSLRHKRLVPFLAILAAVGVLIGLEPDIGTLGVFALTALAMYVVAQTPISHLFIMAPLGFGALFALVKIFPHAMQRVQVLFHPELADKSITYQMDQITIGLGSGGIFGQGLAQGKQKFLYLPQPAGDSIAAVIGEELGFLGMIFLISLFATLALHGLKIARHAPDEFSRLLAAGLTSLLVIQAFINILAISGLIPLTGIPLPFVSYGGTSLVVSLVAVGILLNISKHSIK
ncbi:MAG: putative lipid II flippase FtsW [bacterium]